jgi:ribosomal protein S24E
MKNQTQHQVKFFDYILDKKWKIEYNILILRKKLFGRINMANAKNYTEEMVSEMTTAYTDNPTRETVDELARHFGKTTRSIIAKLSREGVYVAQPRTTKSGEPVVAKAELVSEIQEHFGIELPTLVKAGKADLQRLVDAISQ